MRVEIAIVILFGLMIWLSFIMRDYSVYTVSVLKDDKLNVDVKSNGGVVISSKVITPSKDQIINLVSAKLTDKIKDIEISDRTKAYGKKMINYLKHIDDNDET